MDKMLHRGEYAIESEAKQPLPQSSRWSLKSILGITDEFSRGDKFVYAYAYFWSWFSFFLALTVTTIALIWDISNYTWSRIHMYSLLYLVIISFGIAVWLTAGGCRDFWQLIKDLKTAKRNSADDGRVVNHQNLDEIRDEAALETSNSKK